MNIQTRFTRFWPFILLVAILLLIAACGTVSPGVSPTPTPIAAAPAEPLPTPTAEPEPASPTPTVPASDPASPTPTIPASDTPGPTPTVPAPSPTPTVSPIPPESLAAELQATVAAGLPPSPTPDTSGYAGPAIEGISVITLTNTTGEQPLWAAFSHGLRNFDPLQNHFVAIYSHDESGWQELARQELEDVDYLDPASVDQVQLEPSHVWLRVQGGAGAHSGVFNLLRFDGQTLALAVSHFSSSPGGSRLEDLNEDGMPEVLLDATDYYVFCYACGARFIQYQVLHWDGNELSEVTLSPLPESAPAELRELNNRAVALAEARLLQEAETLIEQAQALDGQEPAVTWNAAMINLLLEEQSEQARNGPYPLLESIFYGNYEASLEVMRAYPPEEIFSQPTPLISGTVAEGWEESIRNWILDLTSRAIEVEPELAAAYFLRGWANFLADPASLEVLTNVQRAAELDPQDTLFSQSLEYLQQQ